MVDIEITERKKNDLLKREEIKFKIEHLGQGSPNRIEVKEKLAAMETAKADLVFIKNMKGQFSLPILEGTAHIYDDVESAKKIESRYVKVRNVEKDKRQDLKKELKGAK